MAYAKDTNVSADRTRAEIEKTLQRYGAIGFAYGYNGEQALIGFFMRELQVRFLLPLPGLDDPAVTRTPTGLSRSTASRKTALEQIHRQRWRAMLLVVKAKLEAVESGIVTFEEEFGPFVVLPDGSRMIDHMGPAIHESYTTGQVPSLLPGLGTRAIER